MNTKKLIPDLRNEPIFWSRLGLGYVTPEFAHVFPVEDYTRYGKFHDDFSDSDVPVHTCILPNGWYKDGPLDFELTDKILDTLFKSGKVKYFFPRIKLNVPVDWCKSHPEEVLVYHNGPRKAEEIAELVGSLKHDILGYETPSGFYNAGKVVDNRPNVNGTISMQSFSSNVWLKEAGEKLRQLIRHLEDGPYSDKIIGYQFAHGVSGESMLWGRQDYKFGDYGIANQREFFKWYKENVDNNATWESGDFVPSPEERSAYGDDIYTQFRSKKKNAKAIAYDTFMTEVNQRALNHFGKIIKEESGKLAGAFYGYLLHVSRSAYTGFLGWKELLNSEYIDFYAAPKSYYCSGFGMPGGEMSPVYSVNRKRLWIDECDIRTHRALDTIGGKAKNFDQTAYLMWREFTKNTAHNSGCWWMDLGDGWYDDKEIMAEVKLISKINREIKFRPSTSVADILYVVDEESFKYADDRFNQQLLEANLRHLQLCGCAINVCLQSDLSEIDVENYKLIVLANAFCMTKKELSSLEERTNARILFNYASGICGGVETDLKNCEALTGFKYTAEKGAPAKLKAEGKSDRYFVNPDLPADVTFFRDVCEKSNCHIYSPVNTFVYTDSRILGVFSDKPIDFDISLRSKCNIKNIITGEVFMNVDKVTVKTDKCFSVFEFIN